MGWLRRSVVVSVGSVALACGGTTASYAAASSSDAVSTVASSSATGGLVFGEPDFLSPGLASAAKVPLSPLSSLSSLSSLSPAVHVEEVSRAKNGMGVGIQGFPLVVSADGSTVLFTALQEKSRWELQARRRSEQRTITVSATSAGVPADGGEQFTDPAVSADGSEAFFTWYGASNLTPSGSTSYGSKVFIKNLATAELSSVIVPTVDTPLGTRRPIVAGHLSVTADGRLITVHGYTDGAGVRETLRYDRTTKVWSVLCEGIEASPSCAPGAASADGRYVVIDDAVHDLVAGTVTPLPLNPQIGLPQHCQFTGDSRSLVCDERQTARPGPTDVTTITWYALPANVVTRRVVLPRFASVDGVDRHGDHLAVSIDRFQPAHQLLALDAYSYALATGVATRVAVTPDGAPSLMTSVAAGMSDAGEVVFLSVDQSLAPPDRGPATASAYVATLRP